MNSNFKRNNRINNNISNDNNDNNENNNNNNNNNNNSTIHTSKEYPMFLNCQYPVPQERVEYNYNEYYNVLHENQQPHLSPEETQVPVSARKNFSTYQLPGMPPLELYQPLPLPPLQLHSQQQSPLHGRNSIPSLKAKPVIGKRLIRTSSLPASSGNSQKHFETRRVFVELDGDLETMTMNWTDEEIENRRRLVMFKWHQSRSKIRVTFQPVSQEQYHPDMTVVSCIYDDKDKFLFTSVDFINFFESLANSKFKIEEKNRIRRNLQSLKPLTITKQYNSELFSLIMDFGTPKPRNIEKNVKVFFWNRFQQLLSKIASKYSIDYQSHEVLQLPSSLQQHPQSSVSNVSYQGEVLLPMHASNFTFYHPQQQVPGLVEQVDQFLPLEQGNFYPDDQLSRSFYAYLPNFPY